MLDSADGGSVGDEPRRHRCHLPAMRPPRAAPLLRTLLTLALLLLAPAGAKRKKAGKGKVESEAHARLLAERERLTAALVGWKHTVVASSL